jgi:SAM-dependent methyltransferase
MNSSRLTSRKLKIWRQDYLTYRYLWKNLESAVEKALHETSNANPFILDVGCGNKPYADLFEGFNYKGMDCTEINSSPDIIGEATNIPIESSTVDIVFSTQVIEHVSEPKQMLKECYRVLKPGGFLVMTGPFYWPLHEEPFDFYRFTKYGFEYLLKDAGFSELNITSDGGSWAQIFLSINIRMRSKLLIIFRVLFNLIGETLDKIDYDESSTANYTILARKSELS